MRLLGGCGVCGAVTAVALSVFFAVTESPFHPQPWQEVGELQAMEGPLFPNHLLSSATHLYEAEDDADSEQQAPEQVQSVVAPESFAFGPDGTTYSGLADGRVVAMDERGENARTVFHSGAFVSSAGRQAGSKDGLDFGSPLPERCSEKAQNGTLSRSQEAESECGRVLGMRWRQDEDKLYFVDAYNGLFTLSFGTGGTATAEQLVNSRVQKPSPPAWLGEGGAAHEDVSREMRFLNDLDFGPDGVVYMTDSSWKCPRQQNRVEIIDAAARGRLLRFDPRAAGTETGTGGSLTTLMYGLHFANGVEVDQTREGLLLVESMRFRILRVSLEAAETGQGLEMDVTKALPQAGRPEEGRPEGGQPEGPGPDSVPSAVSVWASDIPGFGDNLRFDAKTKGYLLGCGTLVARPFSLLNLMFKLPLGFRVGLGKVVPLHVIEKLVPRYGLVIAFDLNGGIKASYQDPGGHTPFISSAERHPSSNALFLGSSQNPFLGRAMLP